MRALPNATVELLGDGSELITLPVGIDGAPIDWPELSSNELFVRPIFRDFYEKAEHLNAFHLDNQHRNWLLRGVPGIGKSSFGLYCLWRLVKEGRRVRYWYPRGSSAVMDFGGSGRCDAYIVDGAAPATLMSTPTLLISSPRGGTSLDGGDKTPIYDDFVKRTLVRHLFLPSPTVDELLLLGSTCFPGVPARDILSCIDRWGRVIRPIFAVPRDMELKALEEAIVIQKTPALKELARSMSEKVVIKDVSFRVVHYDIDDTTYHSIRGFKWASEYIEQRVFEVLQRAEMHDRLGLLQEMLLNRSSLAMSQKLFESWCNLVMQRGCGSGAYAEGFRVRRLGIGKVRGSRDMPDAEASMLQAADKALGLSLPDESGVYRLLVQPAKTLLLQKPDELCPAAVDKHTRWKTKSCFAAADFVEATGFCSNATVSDSHELLLQGTLYNNGLRAILEHLQPSALADSLQVVPFVWLVPALVFPHVTVGSQVVEVAGNVESGAARDGDQLTSRDPTKLQAARLAARQLGRRVVQYALEIPNPHDFRTVDAAAEAAWAAARVTARAAGLLVDSDDDDPPMVTSRVTT
jgi:hypothetical protein